MNSLSCLRSMREVSSRCSDALSLGEVSRWHGLGAGDLPVHG